MPLLASSKSIPESIAAWHPQIIHHTINASIPIRTWSPSISIAIKI